MESFWRKDVTGGSKLCDYKDMFYFQLSLDLKLVVEMQSLRIPLLSPLGASSCHVSFIMVDSYPSGTLLQTVLDHDVSSQPQKNS